MPAVLVRSHAERGHYGLKLGIVNNMPDAAMAATLRQFLDVLEAASAGFRVQVYLFSLPDLMRGEVGKRHLRENLHFDTRQLPLMELDALIVTGTEPKRTNLKEEDYWPALAQMFDWIDAEGPPAVFSCLAAHAAVLHYDGIERRRLPEKRFGLFHHTVVTPDALTDGLPPSFDVAHSRWNEVPKDALLDAGYRILTASPEAGSDLFVAQRRNPLLFFQGHPEYDARALGLEYRRDVRRYLVGERADYPNEPCDYFNPAERELLGAFRARAQDTGDETLMNDFPPLAERFRTTAGVSLYAANVYGAWLRGIADAKQLKRRTIRRGAVEHAGA